MWNHNETLKSFHLYSWNWREKLAAFKSVWSGILNSLYVVYLFFFQNQRAPSCQLNHAWMMIFETVFDRRRARVRRRRAGPESRHLINNFLLYCHKLSAYPTGLFDICSAARTAMFMFTEHAWYLEIIIIKFLILRHFQSDSWMEEIEKHPFSSLCDIYWFTAMGPLISTILLQ